MSLQAGHKLAHYEILEPIGRGGMGEVYRAKDSKLGRDVAIKVLPDEFAQDEERLRRFQREAKVLASLNHPNIASIYGLEQSGETHYLVLELVPGETLAERIARGPIPVEEALEIATQIAEALEEAHEHGIVHRDLKPANIKITEDDKVKILDFGLAKAFSENRRDADAATSMSPTITRDATQIGVILGTAAYMSPEQAKGKAVDKQSDIFSFGVVLYEMLSGRRAFAGDDVHETLAAVINKDIDWDALGSSTPSSVRRLLRRSLVKDRRERLADIADALLEIRDAANDEEPLIRSTSASAWKYALAAALAATAFVAGVVWNGRAPDPPMVARLTMSPPPDESIRVLTYTPGVAITPDGSKIVYTSGPSADRKLLVRALDEMLAATLVVGSTATIDSHFVSPDSRWVGYKDGGALRKVPIGGGPSTKICDVISGQLRGASWGDDGTIVFAMHSSDNLYRVSADGGEAELIPVRQEARFQFPNFLPGSKAVLHNVRPTYGYGNTVPELDRLDESVGYGAKVGVTELESGELRVLFDGYNPRYAASGHIVFGRDNGLWAVAFDAGRLEVLGEPRPMVEQVFTKLGNAVDFAISKNGTLVYLSGRLRETRNVVWVDRSGSATDLGFGENSYSDGAVSPDGKKIAMWVEGNVWVYDVDRGSRIKLTTEVGMHPVWTPDGSHVVVEISGAGLFLRSADGSGEAEPLIESETLVRPGSWSPDGSVFTYVQGGDMGLDIWAKSDDGTVPLVRTPHDEEGPMFSPDGRWLAYVSNETGNFEVFVSPFPGPGERVIVSVGGGRAPVWSPSGDELFYRDLDGRMIAVSIEGEETLRVGQPELIFDGPYSFPAGGDPHYDVWQNGQRFLMIDESGSAGDDSGEVAVSQAVVVLNWFEELKLLASVDN